MQTPQILQQLGRSQLSQTTAKVKQLMNTVRMARNPQAMMNQMLQTNPQLKQAMNLINTSGKTPEQTFYALAEQMGVNPQDVLDSLASVAAKQEVTLSAEGGPAVVVGVWQLLHEMVYNLCDNAIKYNFPGGKVIMETLTDEKSTKLVVEDTGIGIPPEHQKRVFERFYRVDRSHSKEIGGTGLGLSIVKHGAMYHDAEVSMESTPGKGTKITITFPKTENE